LLLSTTVIVYASAPCYVIDGLSVNSFVAIDFLALSATVTVMRRH